VWLSCLIVAALGLAGLAYALAKSCKKVMREHNLVDLFLRSAGVIAVVDTVVLKSLGSVHGGCAARVGHRD
jgi:hypothetical protein